MNITMCSWLDGLYISVWYTDHLITWGDRCWLPWSYIIMSMFGLIMDFPNCNVSVKVHITSHQPYPHVKPNYGVKLQYAQEEDNSPALNKEGKLFIQEVCGVFLFLARAVDDGLLTPLSSLASQQANPTETSMVLCKKFLVHGNTRRGRTHLQS